MFGVVPELLLDAAELTGILAGNQVLVSGERAQALDPQLPAAPTGSPMPQVPTVGDALTESPGGPAGCGLDRAICGPFPSLQGSSDVGCDRLVVASSRNRTRILGPLSGGMARVSPPPNRTPNPTAAPTVPAGWRASQEGDLWVVLTRLSEGAATEEHPGTRLWSAGTGHGVGQVLASVGGRRGPAGGSTGGTGVAVGGQRKTAQATWRAVSSPGLRPADGGG